jgi:hypothetical protein
MTVLVDMVACLTDGQQACALRFTRHRIRVCEFIIIIIIIKALPVYDDFMYTTQIPNHVIVLMINIFTYRIFV